jgi:U3 small nucleolar RNA-associated protein 3
MDDYIDEEMQQGWQAAEDRTKEEETKSLFVISKENNVEALDDNERLALLNQLFPEFVPMLKELTSLKQRLVTFSVSPSNELVELKKTALSSYLGALSSYFALFVDNLKSNNSFTTMKDNEVMETILSCREVWRQADELPDEPTQINIQTEELSQSEEHSEVSEDEEVSEDMEEEFVDASETPAVDDEDEFNIDTKAARKIKKVSKKEINDFTETVGPEDVDMEDKQRRKKTLRFYTSKIDQAATKNRDKLTGDADLPYRERLFERQQRLIEEARKRGLGQDSMNLGADLDDNDVGSDDERLAGEINENDIEYYESLKQSKAQEKELRRENHEKAVKAAKEGKLAELQEELGADGKRAINYQILKNKGLTPHRKKEYRNSRVKKRKQYEKAQKKLKSVRQVYNGENRGPYEGEKTGIKKNLSRSVKLV